MPKAAGWYIRSPNTYSSQNGTADSLTVNVQTATVDNDIMIMHITHQGAGYATVPAGWTLIAQNIGGPIRGEIFWKRASSEPASYTLTGTGAVSVGFMMSYGGGLLSGSPVDASINTVTAIGTSTKFVSNALTTTTERALVICAMSYSVSANCAFRFSQTDTLGDHTDWDIRIPTMYRDNAGAGAVSMGYGHVLKVMPGTTDNLYVLDTFNGDRIGFIISLIPETAAETSGTRYYWGSKSPNKFLYGPTQVQWNSSVDSPRNYKDEIADFDFVYELTQNKTDAGPVTAIPSTLTALDSIVRGGGDTNIQGENILYYRWVTPPLAAQSLGGNISFVIPTYCYYEEGCEPGPGSSITGTWRVHAYVTVGNTLDYRSPYTLINDYVDATPWSQADLTFRTLTLPILPGAGTVTEGDRIVIEFGCHIVASSITPTCEDLPASNYAQIWLARGAASTRNPSISQPGLPDAISGNIIIASLEGDARACPYIDFTDTVVELADTTTIPTNISEGTAVIIPSLPYQSPEINTRRVPNPNRKVYYKWTPERSGKVYAVALRSCYQVLIIADYAGFDDDEDYADDVAGGATSRSTTQFTATEGEEVTFTVMSALVIDGTVYAAPCHGGVLNFGVFYDEVPEDGDVILACSKFLARYRDSTLVGLSRFSSGTALSGLAIDYTERAMTLAYTPPYTDTTTVHRLMVGFFGADSVGIYELASLDVVDFITITPLAGTHLSSCTMSEAGQLYVGWFGDGFQYIAGAQYSYLDQVSDVDEAKINSIDGTHADDQPGAPWPDATLFTAALQVGGTNYIELDPEGTTIYYTSGGWYVPVGGTLVKRVDASSGAQLADFATVTSTGPNPGLKGLFPMPNGLGVLVCAGARIVRLNASGVETQVYTVPEADRGSSFTDVELCSDAEHFWALEEISTTLYKFNLETGAVVIDNWVPYGFGSSTSIVVYRANAYPPPEPATGGIYKVVPNKRNDTIWTDVDADETMDVKIPNPKVRTGLFGN